MTRIERFNLCGVHTRGICEGGIQGYVLADANRGWRDACLGWQRTSAMLGATAEDWERYAENADVGARQRLLKG